MYMQQHKMCERFVYVIVQILFIYSCVSDKHSVKCQPMNLSPLRVSRGIGNLYLKCFHPGKNVRKILFIMKHGLIVNYMCIKLASLIYLTEAAAGGIL